MIDLLARIFIRDHEKIEDSRVRTAYGTLVSVTAIVFNLLLSAAKFIIGTLAGSVSITADAVNNLSDAGSSLLMLLGFRFAEKKPEPEHPFGHGRIEYVMGLVVAAIILYAGIDSLRSAIERIIRPEALDFSWAAVLVLVISVLVKVYMSFFHKKTGKRIGSATMVMAGKDALTDTISTALALVCLLLYKFTGLNLDAYAGLVVAVLLLKTGFEGGRDTLSQLMGQKADPETVEKVREIVLAYPEIMDIHDMVIHDYGPGRFHVSLHAEVDGEGNIYELHEAMDRAMLELDHKLGCMSVIHMDPVDTKNEELASLREELGGIIAGIDPALSFHDLRMIPGPHYTNLVFDVLEPFGFKMTNAELTHAIRQAVSKEHPGYNCVIQIDKPFT